METRKQQFINWVSFRKLKKATPRQFADTMENAFSTYLGKDVWSMDANEFTVYRDMLLTNKDFKKKQKKAHKLLTACSKIYLVFLTNVVGESKCETLSPAVAQEPNNVGAIKYKAEYDRCSKFFNNKELAQRFYQIYEYAKDKEESTFLDVRATIIGAKKAKERLRFYADKNGMLRFAKIEVDPIDLASSYSSDVSEYFQYVDAVNSYFLTNRQEVLLEDETENYVFHKTFGFGRILKKDKQNIVILFDEQSEPKTLQTGHQSYTEISDDEYSSKVMPDLDSKKETKSVNRTANVTVEKENFDTDMLSSLIDNYLLDAKNGVSKKDICDKFSEWKMCHIDIALSACHPVVILKKYYHRNNIFDYDAMAETLLDIIMKLFYQNCGYASAKMLYVEAHQRLDDFFFYNNAFDSIQEVYDLAMHLFAQENYKGCTFVFANGMHIWQKEPDYPKDYHGLMIKFAREHGNSFSREEALEYFECIGSKSPAATFSNMMARMGCLSFLQFAENRFVLIEALRIDENFLSQIRSQIEVLLDGEDYVAIGDIDDYFYTTLPTLPNGICWSALLVEDILRVYDIGFTTIEAGHDNDKKTLPAAIVRKNSTYKSFADVVWSEVAKTFSLPKEFTASEFRDFLLEKGFIRGLEKMWSVHKTVAGDIRFYWTDQYGKVTIS